MIWLFDIAFIALVAWMWWEGGGKNSWVRDWVLPAVLALYVGFKLWNWIPGVLSYGSFLIIHIGYGIPDKDDKGSWLGRTFSPSWLARGMAGVLYGIVGACIAFIFAQAWIAWAGYTILNFGVNALGEKFKLKRNLMDSLVGIGVGCLCLFL